MDKLQQGMMSKAKNYIRGSIIRNDVYFLMKFAISFIEFRDIFW